VTSHDDLKSITNQSDWFVTIAIPAPSNLDDAQACFELEWRNARRQLSADWDDSELEQLDELVGGLRHDDGASFVIVHGRHGSTLLEPLDEPVSGPSVHEGPLPRWATVIESRQRALAHVMVEADRAGADLTAFDGGDVLSTETVDGSTEHIHRGHPGGWSQRRFQQRAENTWEDNARQVAEAIAMLARKVDAALVAVAGDIRAQTFILESLPADIAQVAVRIEAGSPDGIAAEVVRLLASKVAERVTAAAEAVRAGIPTGTASTDSNVIMDALRDGRVARLLVHDDGTPGDQADPTSPDGTRLVDRAIVAALATDAEILVVPHLAMMDGPLAATMRW
jgi:hypothetical protein